MMSDKILDKEKFKNQIKIAFKEITITKNNQKESVSMILFSLILALSIGFSEKTVSNALKITDIFLTAHLAIFACLFTAYSIAITFLKDEYISLLYKSPDKIYGNYLNKATTYYESVSYLYFIGILASLSYKIVLNLLDDNFLLFASNNLNDIFSTFTLLVYFTYSIRILIELKSVIKNTSFILRAGLQCKLWIRGDDKND